MSVIDVGGLRAKGKRGKQPGKATASTTGAVPEKGHSRSQYSTALHKKITHQNRSKQQRRWDVAGRSKAEASWKVVRPQREPRFVLVRAAVCVLISSLTPPILSRDTGARPQD